MRFIVKIVSRVLSNDTYEHDSYNLCLHVIYFTEPLYMRQNPTQYFFSTKAECCEVSLTNRTLFLMCLSICI
jgi:hypothetical protein